MKVPAGVILSACALLAGCAAHPVKIAAPHPVSLLDDLAGQVTSLGQQASQGNRQAGQALHDLLSGQGVQVLMAQRSRDASGA